MKLSNLFIAIIIFSSFAACKKVSPQLPSNKVVETNPDASTLLEINKKLASKEDSLLVIYIKKQNKSFTKSELGFWYRIDRKKEGKSLKNNEICKIDYQLKLLNAKTVLQESKVFTIGKKEIFAGLEEGVKMLHRGEKATFVIPWYLGYGMHGLENKIPPYTSIICEVELKE